MQYESYAQRFIERWEQFMIACDALEESGEWNKELYGEMEGYYENDMVCIILRIIVADDRVTVEEADMLNRCYGFKYTPEELRELYACYMENTGDDPDAMLTEGYRLLKSINEKLAANYADIVEFACGMIAESDGSLASFEFKTANHIIGLFKQAERAPQIRPE